ncbi:MAG: Sec-independent protein translocase subunit TatA/TatB [Mycobacterium sp.]
MFGLGWQELVIVLVIIMIIFGAGKLPEVVKSLGQGVKEFKQESSGATDSLAAASATGEAYDNVQSAERTKVRADEI